MGALLAFALAAGAIARRAEWVWLGAAMAMGAVIRTYCNSPLNTVYEKKKVNAMIDCYERHRSTIHTP